MARKKRTYQRRQTSDVNGQLTVKAMTITPEMAQKWIEATGDQNYRKPGEWKVAEIANDLKRGKWQLNGETIKLAGDVVIDGMHRLHGIVKAGVPMETFVVEGVSLDNMLTIDRGRQRTFGQELRYRKVPDWPAAAAVTTGWLALQRGMWKTDSHRVKQGVSDVELWAWFTKRQRQIGETARMISEGHSNFCARQFVSAGILGPVILEGTRQNFATPRDSELATIFVTTLATGDAETTKDPVVSLRNRMIQDRASKANRPTPQMVRALTIHAWNLLCQGEQVGSYLRYRLTGKSAQEFPEIIQAEE